MKFNYNQIIKWWDSNNYSKVTIILTGNNKLEVQLEDVIGYYHPLHSRYQVRIIQTDGYVQYWFNISFESVDINSNVVKLEELWDHQNVLANVESSATV